MKYLVSYFLPANIQDQDLDHYELRKRSLFIIFTLVATSAIIVFNISHIATGKYYSALINTGAAIFYLIALMNYKFRDKFIQSAKILIYVSILLAAAQHFTAPIEIFGNMMWLPLTIYVSFYIMPIKPAFNTTLFAIVMGCAAYLGPLYFDVTFDQFTGADIKMINLMLITLTVYIAFVISKNIAIQQKMMLTELEDANKELLGVRESNATLLSILTHDINNSITQGYHYSKVLSCEEFEDPKLAKANKKIKTCFDDLLRITTDVRNLKAMEFGKLNVPLSKVNVKQSILKSIESVEHRNINKNVTINTFHLFERYYVEAEPVAVVFSVIANILSNAIKFSLENGKIDISIKEIEGKKIAIVIRDYGIGMPANILENLFDPVAHTTRQGTNGEKGTGFGMPIAKIFMEKFNGDIKVKSYEGEDSEVSGTEFMLIFNSWSNHNF